MGRIPFVGSPDRLGGVHGITKWWLNFLGVKVGRGNVARVGQLLCVKAVDEGMRVRRIWAGGLIPIKLRSPREPLTTPPVFPLIFSCGRGLDESLIQPDLEVLD